MGAYLSQPVKEKESSDGGNVKVKFGTSAMQGWRTSMEDSHCAVPDLDEHTSFFAVFDGHGGKEVAGDSGDVYGVERSGNEVDGFVADVAIAGGVFESGITKTKSGARRRGDY